jgi:hypothetical protein
MPRSHRLVEIFHLRIIGAKAYVLFKKDLEFGGERSGKEILFGDKQRTNDTRLGVRQKEIAVPLLLWKIRVIVIERITILAPRLPFAAA